MLYQEDTNRRDRGNRNRSSWREHVVAEQQSQAAEGRLHELEQASSLGPQRRSASAVRVHS